MREIILLLMFSVLITSGCTNNSIEERDENILGQVNKKEVVEVQEDSEVIKLLINSDKVEFSHQNLYIDKNLVFIPLNLVKEKLGAEVTWMDEKKKIIIQLSRSNQKTKIMYNLESSYYSQEYFDKYERVSTIDKLDFPIKIIQNNVLIPLNSIASSFGYKTKQDLKEQVIYLEVNKESIKPSASEHQYQVDGDIFYLKKIELDLFYLTNAERLKRGINPLILDIKNSEVARIKSKDLHDNKYFGHQSPKLGSPFKMLVDYGVEYTYAGENLAAGFTTAEEVMNGWLESQGHKENLLRSEFERVGFGYYTGPLEYNDYYTQIFTTR